MSPLLRQPRKPKLPRHFAAPGGEHPRAQRGGFPIKTVTFTAHAQGSLGAAGALSQRLGHDYVGSEHLLLGLLQ